MLPVKFPFKSVVTSVNGLVFTPIEPGIPGIVPVGGLKLMVGKFWTNAGVAVGGVLNGPESFEKKKRPLMVVVEIGCAGTTQLIVLVLELRVVEPEETLATMESTPEAAPE